MRKDTTQSLSFLIEHESHPIYLALFFRNNYKYHPIVDSDFQHDGSKILPFFPWRVCNLYFHNYKNIHSITPFLKAIPTVPGLTLKSTNPDIAKTWSDLPRDQASHQLLTWKIKLCFQAPLESQAQDRHTCFKIKTSAEKSGRPQTHPECKSNPISFLDCKSILCILVFTRGVPTRTTILSWWLSQIGFILYHSPWIQ